MTLTRSRRATIGVAGLGVLSLKAWNLGFGASGLGITSPS